MKYRITIFPSKTIQDKANSFRKRYDPNYSLIPPHITLKSEFETDKNTIDEIVTSLKHIANEFEPFKINITKVSTFAPVTNTIYFKIEPVQELIDLHSKMHGDNFPKNLVHPFVPHITIAQNLVEDEYSDVLGSLSMSKVEHEDTIDRFQLLYQLENGSWTVHETFVFGKEYV